MKRLLVLAAVSAAFFCFHAHSINAADSRHSLKLKTDLTPDLLQIRR